MLIRTLLASSVLTLIASSNCYGQEVLPAPHASRAEGNVIETPTSWLPQAQAREIAPYAGYVNHAHNSPTFRWGWFGAEHYYPRVHWHQNYVGDRVRWSTQRRY